MTEVKRLPEILKRNGITYRIVKRTDNIALWELTIYGKCVGYEVNQIYKSPEQFRFGKLFTARESLPPDSWFAVFDKSKSFFPHEFPRAKQYYENLSNELYVKNSYDETVSV